MSGRRLAWGTGLPVHRLSGKADRAADDPADFPDHPFKVLSGTPRLLERQGRHDPLGDFPG